MTAARGAARAPVQRSEAQREASRLNGAKGRGPVTPEGKAISSQNASKHGLFAKSLRPPADFRGLHEVFEQVHDGLLEQAGDRGCTDRTLVASAASKAAQLVVLRRLQQHLMAPPPPPSSSASTTVRGRVPQFTPLPPEELSALRASVERLEAGLPAWSAGAAFDCTPEEARELAKSVSQLIEGARENAEECGDVFDEPHVVTPEQRASFETDLRRKDEERAALWRELGAREQAERRDHEQRFLASVATMKERNEAELRGLKPQEKVAARAAFDQTLEQQQAEHARSIEALRARQLRDRAEAMTRLEALSPRRGLGQQSRAELAESEEREAARDRQILEWGDGDRLRDEKYVAVVLTGPDSANVVEGDHERLVNLLREVLALRKDCLATEDARAAVAFEREAGLAAEREAEYARTLLERLPQIEQLERLDRMLTRGMEGPMQLLGLLPSRRQ